jgi:hypothetical protein
MKNGQNRSNAVMATRIEDKDSLDDFPTPPWATRALIEHVIGGVEHLRSQVCLEPACGAGHMAKVLSEYFGDVRPSDIHPYGYGEVQDFLATPHATRSCDWVITNPPFCLGEDFITTSLKLAKRGVAMLTRTVFIESVGRYERLFLTTPPSRVAQFAERVPMLKGRLDRSASTATGYAWLVWDKERSGRTELVWIPPCRKKLERDDDYSTPGRPAVGRVKTSRAKARVRPTLLPIVARKHDLFGDCANWSP